MSAETEVKHVNRVATPLCVDKQSVELVVRESVSRGNDDIALSCVERVGVREDVSRSNVDIALPCVERVKEESKITGTDDSDFVTVSFGNGDIVARKDSGADWSIVHPSCIPASVLMFCTRLVSPVMLE